MLEARYSQCARCLHMANGALRWRAYKGLCEAERGVRAKGGGCAGQRQYSWCTRGMRVPWVGRGTPRT
eukprot:449394-Rhodomonas_salina.2